jgi:hypothetical protein
MNQQGAVMNDAEELRRVEQLIEELRGMRRPYGVHEPEYARYSRSVSGLLAVAELIRERK